MKRCPHCNKTYESGNYCTSCGNRLVEINEFDIFGDPLYTDTKIDNNDSNTINNQELPLESNNFLVEKRENLGSWFGRFLSILSIGALFAPIFGQAVCIAALLFNILGNNDKKRQLPYTIISLITFILSIVFFVLLIKNGVIQDLIQTNGA